jgi:GTPase involved in cell partitioning and DNA repair
VYTILLQHHCYSAQDCHAVVWLVDTSEQGSARWNEAQALFQEAIAHPYLANKPLLVLCNKADAAATDGSDAHFDTAEVSAQAVRASDE